MHRFVSAFLKRENGKMGKRENVCEMDKWKCREGQRTPNAFNYVDFSL